MDKPPASVTYKALVTALVAGGVSLLTYMQTMKDRAAEAQMETITRIERDVSTIASQAAAAAEARNGILQRLGSLESRLVTHEAKRSHR